MTNKQIEQLDNLTVIKKKVTTVKHIKEIVEGRVTEDSLTTVIYYE